MELERRLHGLSLESCKDVAEYTRKFQETDFKLKSLHSDLALPEPYLIYRYLNGLGDAYQTFVAIYLKIHNLVGDNKVSFTNVSLATANHEQWMRSKQERSSTVTLARNNGNSCGSGRGGGRRKDPFSAMSAGSMVTHESTAPTRLPAKHVPAHASKKIVKRRPERKQRMWRASRSIQQGVQAKQGRRQEDQREAFGNSMDTSRSTPSTTATSCGCIYHSVKGP